ncbi:MAG: acyltransferase [Gammaproteobacteria bacterium]
METEKTGNQQEPGLVHRLRRYSDIIGDAGEFPVLDGLRAIAILLVLLRHAVHYREQGLEGSFWNIFYNGWIGVDLFFVLSGFLISYHLLSKWPQHFSWRFIGTYFIKRALRILPLYFVILLLIVLYVIPYYSPPNPVTLHSLGLNLVFLQDYFSSATLLVPLWSLAVEEKFYLLAPLLILLARVANGKVLILSVLVFILLQHYLKMPGSHAGSYSEYFWAYKAPFHFSVVGILCGFIVAYSFLRFQVSEGFKRALKWFTWCSLPLILLLLFSERWMETGDWNRSSHVTLFLTVLFSLVIYNYLLQPLSPGNFLTGRTMRFIARLSYSLYLCHITIIPMTERFVSGMVEQNALFAFSIYFAVYILLSFCFSILLYLLVEKPFLMMKGRFRYNEKV